MPWLSDAETNIHDWAQSLAAERSGQNVVFADLRDATTNNGQCASGDQRLVAGLVDTTSATSYNLPVHLTDAGVTEVATLISQTF